MSVQSAPGTRRWWALGLIAAAQFMVIMDTSIIGVALPQMQADLGFTQQNLSWVFNAYVVAFGGLLLPAGSSPPAGPSCSPGPPSPAWPAPSASNWPAAQSRAPAPR